MLGVTASAPNRTFPGSIKEEKAVASKKVFKVNYLSSITKTGNWK
jgi:hypothetical protein